MHASISLLAVLGFATSTLASTERSQGVYEYCTNYGAEWCHDGEILTCQEAVQTTGGWVRSTHKACADKRELGSWCRDLGATWCWDYKVLTCKDHHVTRTGAGCDSSRPEPHRPRPDRPHHTPRPSASPAPPSNHTVVNERSTDPNNDDWKPRPRPHRPHRNETHSRPEYKEDDRHPENERRDVQHDRPWPHRHNETDEWHDRHHRPHRNETHSRPPKKEHEARDVQHDRDDWKHKHNGTDPRPGRPHRPHRNETHGRPGWWDGERDHDHDGE